jgi:Icc-related predicted phosphoesterase
VKIKIVSDFHVEFWNFNKFERLLDKYLPPHPDDKQTVLCCAGDMGVYAQYPSTYKLLFQLLSQRFRRVIIVPGNHSWYSSAGIWGNEAEFWKDKKLPKNVSYLDNGFTIIDGVAFIGSCLWTDFSCSDPLAIMDASRGMNDFRCIKVRNYEVSGVYGTVINSACLTPEDTVVRHYVSRQFIEKSLALNRDKPCVVISHHAPSFQSVSDRFKADSLNAAFYSNLEELILHYQPAVWAHGHMHDSKDYLIGDTRVVCNPLGYHGAEINKGFNPDLTIEL